MRKVLSLLITSVLGLVLSACASLPLVNTNKVGPEVLTNELQESLYYSPAGPSTGDTQEEIIIGFLYAGNGPQDDYAVARGFLTRGFSSKWQPGKETLIQSGPTKVISDTGTRVRILISYDARITEDGTFLSEPGSTREIEFRLLEENNEWRIASAPNLTSLLRPNFEVLFKAASVYFWDKSLSYLIPDVRWFPVKASLATKLTNTMLAGPAEWLAPAAQNIFPAGTKLNINSVTVAAGVASIDLNATALKISAWKLPYLKAQLLATLSAVPGLTQVSVSIQRTVLNITSTSSGMPDTGSNLPVILTDTGLSRIAGTEPMPITAASKYVQKLHATAFSLSNDSTYLALRGEGTVYVYNLGVLTSQERLVDSRSNLLAPSLDAFNAVWSATSNPGDPIRIVDQGGNTVMLKNPYPGSVSIREIALSPEGARLAIVHDSYRGTMVDVYPVVRDKNRNVLSLADPLPLPELGTNIRGLTWADRTTLMGIAVVNRLQQVRSLQIGGALTDGKVMSGALSLVSSIGDDLYYLNENGEVLASKGATWNVIQREVKSLRMSGQ
ncbi:MAG: hypothetical protein RLZ53_613 [Actinomycetota bacterium]|jgi:hypothetical protein